MTKNGKILLGCGGVLLVGLLVVLIGGYFAMNWVEKNLAEGVKADIEAGTEYGKSADQKGCMTESLKRSKAFGMMNIGQGSSLGAFAESCFKAAKPTQDFCAGVPGFWSLSKSDWINAECQKAGYDNQKTGCFYVYNAKHSFCSPPN